jgi:hypothetical protein
MEKDEHYAKVSHIVRVREEQDIPTVTLIHLEKGSIFIPITWQLLEKEKNSL